MKRPMFVWVTPALACLSSSMCSGAYTGTASMDRSRFFKYPQRTIIVPTRLPFLIKPVREDESTGKRVVAPQECAPIKPGCAQYGLGIGKNQPLQAAEASSLQVPPVSNERVYEACRFLQEHEAVREYPSPSLGCASEPQDISESSTKVGNRISYKRQSEDVLIISEGMPRKQEDQHRILTRNLTNSHVLASATGKPIIVAHTSNKLSVNTAWVEMLLHCERTKMSQRNY